MREPLAARDCSMASVLTDKYRMGLDDASLSTDSNENLLPAKPAGNSRCTARSASPQLNLIVINGQVDARVDAEEEEDRDDNEDAQREGAPSDREEAPSIPVPPEDTPSDTPSKRPSTKEFWAALSVHAATAAMDGPGTLPSKRAAASAAAKSLLEDGQAMERINEERTKQRECSTNKFSAKNLQRLKITKEVVRNAASKASVAVLQSGADQGVAAAVASVILLEGGNMARKGPKPSSKDELTPVPSSGSSGGTNGSEPAEKTADSKADRYATETAEEPKEKDDNVSVHTEARDEKVEAAEEEEASLQSYDSAARPRHEDAETQLSFSASRFGRGDKYALTPNTRSTLDAKATPPAAAPGAAISNSAGQASGGAPGRPLSPVYEEAALASINERVARMGEREQRIEKLRGGAAMAAIEEAVAGLDEAPAPAEGAQEKEEPSTTNPSSKASSAASPRRRKSKHPIIKATESLSEAMEIIAPPRRGKKRAPKPTGPLEAVQEPDEPQEQDGVEIEYERREERDDTPVSTVSEAAIKEETGLLKETSVNNKTHDQVQEEEFERKEAGLLAAMGVLEQKLDELEEVAGVDGASAAGKSDETTVSEEGPQGVLRQPTKSFPIDDIDEALEEDATWDEDGNVVNSLGEFRIHSTHDSGVHDSSGVDADLVSLATKEAEETSMEVVLVAPHPSSPIARMRQVRNFFAKKTPKVTFDDRVDGKGHADAMVEEDVPPIAEPDGAPDIVGAHTMFASDSSRGATNLRRRPRKSLLKKLGRSFKSGAKKDASSDTIFVAHDANVAITPVVEYVAPTVVPEAKIDPAKEDAARYIVDASRAVEIDRERSFTAAKAWRAAVGSGSEQTIARLKEPSAYHPSKRVESKRRMLPSIGESASDECTLDASSYTDARRTDHSKASDDSWVDSVWTRLNQTLIGTSAESSSYEEDDDLLSYATSANDSLMTDFTSVARFNFV